MAGNPRALRPHVIRPSPLAQVSHQRALSTLETSELSFDPLFRTHFSLVTQAERGDLTTGRSINSTLESGFAARKIYDGNEWLSQQHREKRRCRRMAILITLIVIAIVTSASIVGWYFNTERRKLTINGVE
ncbi:hypothetical protein GcC1_010006 [Golovinomyces cichoracearum]|uniref:Uncharacterized protein n=1 Tax=Golovinomyces cichoracearum TaxID=62708 RepID=A0A420J7P7_9PEZI|nr:hypothetical protein GcC1_010006 [Golovinomyces cichoracearum]